jgi:hypothetical protein
VIQFLAGIIQSAALEANHSSQKNTNADMDARAILHSFHLQNTLSGDTYGKGSAPFK